MYMFHSNATVAELGAHAAILGIELHPSTLVIPECQSNGGVLDVEVGVLASTLAVAILYWSLHTVVKAAR